MQSEQQHPNLARPEAEPYAREKSKGERVFDRAVYVGLAGVGTFIATLYMSNKFKNGEWLGARYARAVDGLQRFFQKMLPGGASRKMAEETIQTTSLMMGGNAMLLPIGMAEHYKTPIVEGLNVALGDKTPSEQIEKAPRQTWLSLIEGRVLAWGAVFSALITARFAFPKSFEMYCDEFASRTHQVVQWFKRKPALGEEAMKHTASYRLGGIAALDVFATAAAATLLYIGGHFFARRQEERKEARATRRSHSDSVVRDATEREPGAAVMDSVDARAQVQGSKTHEGCINAPSLALEQA